MKKYLPLLTLALGSLCGHTQDLKVYNNYDFVPGSQIVFEDNFRDDQDGEFPAHWNLESGQGVINRVNEEPAFVITKYYSKYAPNIKAKAFLPLQYTVELDTWLDEKYDSNNGIYIEFRNGGEKLGSISTSNSAFVFETNSSKLVGDLPAGIKNEAYFNKWHHIAVAVNEGQIKVYCDQSRVLVVPNSGFKAGSIGIGGDASEGMLMMFKGFRLAAGGGMNLLGKKFTDTKIITHGINFDYNKSSLRPESMGTLNMVAQVLKDNPSLKFEVGGHTDSDGDASYNLKLSQERAEAVKTQLVKMGIDATRLTTKGYGKTKPISAGDTPEAKANNRRVEFVKIP